MTKRKKIEMEIINSNAAGIDVGSKSHFVAVGQSLEDVKEFGVYAEDLTALCLHLKEYGITTVLIAGNEVTGLIWRQVHPIRCRSTLNCLISG